HVYARVAAARAALILTVSEHARSQIALHSGVNPDRIVAIPHGTPSDLRRIDDARERARLRESMRLPYSFLLADALKNPGVLVDAWKKLAPSVRACRK